MVIPIGGMGVPLMGPPPADLQPRFAKIKLCLQIMMFALCGRLIAAAMLGKFGNESMACLNLLLNTLIGIWLLRDDPQVGKIYNFLMTTCCSPCAEQCQQQGGMGCLMSFMICNVITVVLDVILSNAIGQVIGEFEEVAHPGLDPFTGLMLALHVVAMFAGMVAQCVGAWHSWQAYKMARDSGISASGGDWASGGGAGTAYNYRQDNEMQGPSRPANNFTAFGGSGQRLGS